MNIGVKEHNELIKICFDGNKHLKHVLSQEEINKMCIIENRYPLTRMPVCGACEKLAMWHIGGTAICKHCGTITKKPITYSSYLASGYDIDATGETAKSVLNKSMQLRNTLLPAYGE